jgi:hypothetical protein
MVGLDGVKKRKILPCWESNPGRPAHSRPLYRLSYPNFLDEGVVVYFDIIIHHLHVGYEEMHGKPLE